MKKIPTLYERDPATNLRRVIDGAVVAGCECHVPGCALCRSAAPDITIRDSVKILARSRGCNCAYGRDDHAYHGGGGPHWPGCTVGASPPLPDSGERARAVELARRAAHNALIQAKAPREQLAAMAHVAADAVLRALETGQCQVTGWSPPVPSSDGGEREALVVAIVACRLSESPDGLASDVVNLRNAFDNARRRADRSASSSPPSGGSADLRVAAVRDAEPESESDLVRDGVGPAVPADDSGERERSEGACYVGSLQADVVGDDGAVSDDLAEHTAVSGQVAGSRHLPDLSASPPSDGEGDDGHEGFQLGFCGTTDKAGVVLRYDLQVWHDGASHAFRLAPGSLPGLQQLVNDPVMQVEPDGEVDGEVEPLHWTATHRGLLSDRQRDEVRAAPASPGGEEVRYEIHATRPEGSYVFARAHDLASAWRYAAECRGEVRDTVSGDWLAPPEVAGEGQDAPAREALELPPWRYQADIEVVLAAGAQDEALHRIRELERLLERHSHVVTAGPAWPRHRNDLDGAFAERGGTTDV